MSLKNILSVNPSYAADLLVFAAAYIKLNHYDMALQFLDNAVEMFPDILSVSLLIGFFLLFLIQTPLNKF